MVTDSIIFAKNFGKEKEMRINKSNWDTGIYLAINDETIHLTKEQTDLLIQAIQNHMKVI